jgi:pimeloyl-ACP methyl ester carboxylesterase
MPARHAPRSVAAMSALDRNLIATHDVEGGGGCRLHVREWGNPQGVPILFIHGWSQSQLCWAGQVAGPLAEQFHLVTYDLGGHGMSDKDLAADRYLDGRLWADDVAAVISQTGLDRAVLVAWSYGGFVVSDYIRAYGDHRLAGLNLVGAAVMLKPPAFEHIGPDFLENTAGACASDLGANIDAMRWFLRGCTAHPLSSDDWAEALCWNMVVPPEVRAALISRELDGDDVLSDLSLPVLVTHGRSDTIILPSMAEHVLDVCGTATPSWYDDVGHMPFREAPARFDRELGELVASVNPASARLTKIA